jgi:hypothetical protein
MVWYRMLDWGWWVVPEPGFPGAAFPFVQFPVGYRSHKTGFSFLVSILPVGAFGPQQFQVEQPTVPGLVFQPGGPDLLPVEPGAAGARLQSQSLEGRQAGRQGLAGPEIQEGGPEVHLPQLFFALEVPAGFPVEVVAPGGLAGKQGEPSGRVRFLSEAGTDPVHPFVDHVPVHEIQVEPAQFPFGMVIFVLEIGPGQGGMVVLGVVLVVPFVFDHEFQLGILAGMDHREQPQPPLEQEYILVRPGPAAFFQVGGGPGGKPSLAVEIPIVPVEFQPGGVPLFLFFRRIGLGRVHRGPFAPHTGQGQAAQQKEPERGHHGPSPAFYWFSFFSIP